METKITLIKIFILLLTSLQLFASTPCQKISKMQQELQGIPADLRYEITANTPLFKSIKSQDSKTLKKFTKELDEAKGFLSNIKKNLNGTKKFKFAGGKFNFSELYQKFLDKLSHTRSHTQDFFRSIFRKCLKAGTTVVSCMKGIDDIAAFRSNNFPLTQRVTMPTPQISLNANGTIQGLTGSNRGAIYHGPVNTQHVTQERIHFSKKKSPKEIKKFKKQAVDLSDNMAEAGNIKVQEGIGATRYQQKSGVKMQNYTKDNKSVDFTDGSNNYSLKGPYLTGNLTSRYDDVYLPGAKKELTGSQTRVRNKLRRDPAKKKMLKDFEREHGMFDPSSAAHQDELAGRLAQKKYVEAIEGDIKSIMKDLKGNPDANVLIVDLLGHPPSVQKTIKKSVERRLNTLRNQNYFNTTQKQTELFNREVRRLKEIHKGVPDAQIRGMISSSTIAKHVQALKTKRIEWVF